MLWLSILGEGCWRDWVAFGAEGLAITTDLMSPLIISAIGAGPGILINIMIHHGAPITPAWTMGLAALAAAASGATTLRLFRNEDASIMVLTCQFASVVLLTAGPRRIRAEYVVSSRALLAVSASAQSIVQKALRRYQALYFLPGLRCIF